MPTDTQDTAKALELLRQGTLGAWHVEGDFGRVHSTTDFIASIWSPRTADERRMDGESWLDMRKRTNPARAAIEAEKCANARRIAANPDLVECFAAAEASMEKLESIITGLAERLGAADPVVQMLDNLVKAPIDTAIAKVCKGVLGDG